MFANLSSLRLYVKNKIPALFSSCSHDAQNTEPSSPNLGSVPILSNLCSGGPNQKPYVFFLSAEQFHFSENNISVFIKLMFL